MSVVWCLNSLALRQYLINPSCNYWPYQTRPGRWAVLAAMLGFRSKHFPIFHFHRWVLYLARFWRFWVDPFFGTLVYCTIWPIALRQRLSFVCDRCTHTVWRIIAVAYGQSSCRGPPCNAVTLFASGCRFVVTLSTLGVAIMSVMNVKK